MPSPLEIRFLLQRDSSKGPSVGSSGTNGRIKSQLPPRDLEFPFLMKMVSKTIRSRSDQGKATPCSLAPISQSTQAGASGKPHKQQGTQSSPFLFRSPVVLGGIPLLSMEGPLLTLMANRKKIMGPPPSPAFCFIPIPNQLLLQRQHWGGGTTLRGLA